MRINYLAASGAAIAPLAERFGLRKDSVYRHFKAHVTDQYKIAIKVGPHGSEDQLRKLFADGTTSVIENLRSIYGGLSSLWLVAVEAGDNGAAMGLSGKLHDNLKLQATITREIMPSGSVTVNNFVMTDNFRNELMELAKEVPAARPRLIQIVRNMAEGEGLLNVTPEKELAHAE